MTLSTDSPELTAYVLGELDPAARAEVEAAVSNSPELAAEVAALQQTIGSLSAAFAAELNKQWPAPLRPAGSAAQPIAYPAPMRNNNVETLIETG